jgi:hypothetical protein
MRGIITLHQSLALREAGVGSDASISNPSGVIGSLLGSAWDLNYVYMG